MQLPILAPNEAICSGTNCRLPDRIIPADWQKYRVESPQSDAPLTLCRLCLVALNADQKHLFDGRNLFANGFRPGKFPELEVQN